MLTYDAAVLLELLNTNPDTDPNLRRFELKVDTPVTPAPRNVYTNFGFSTLFCFRVRSPDETNRQTDGPTDGQDPYCDVLGQPHDKHQ